VEEFYRPMLVAGLLNSDQLANIFLNVEELIQASARFSSKLRSAIDDALAVGDRDLVSVDVGSVFSSSLNMLRAYDSYCTRQVRRGRYRRNASFRQSAPIFHCLPRACLDALFR